LRVDEGLFGYKHGLVCPFFTHVYSPFADKSDGRSFSNGRFDAFTRVYQNMRERGFRQQLRAKRQRRKRFFPIGIPLSSLSRVYYVNPKAGKIKNVMSEV
jgi:hypothetical protein